MSAPPPRSSRSSRPSLVDAQLLGRLERAFAQMAGPSTLIDAAGLQRALGFRSEYLARRVLLAMDKDGDGVIRRDDFLAGVRALMYGSDRDRLSFAFRLHDDDGDGGIDPHELRRMIALTLAEDDIITDDNVGDELARSLFGAADRNGNGRISFEEFEAVVEGRPELLARMTRHEAMWIAPSEDLLARLETGTSRGFRVRLRRVIENRWVEVGCMALWVIVNMVLFVSGLFGDAPTPGGLWKHLSNAFSTPIAFNAALVLVPVLRRLLTWIRRTPALRHVPVDEAVTFHRILGHTLFGLAVGHGASELVSIATASDVTQQLVRTEVLTGIGWLALFAIMWLFSLAWIRRSGRFELFYFTHLLYIPWFAVAIVHAGSVFFAGGVGVVGLVAEHVIRRRRRNVRAPITRSAAMRSAVTRLEIARPPAFAFSPGDYVFLRVPEIARREWHPFTISSAPESPALTIHVRSLGNWSSALRKRVEDDEALGSTEPIDAYIDGPYGSPSRHIFDSRYAVLIGAGIGVTPFASILESILLRARSGSTVTLKKVHFFWLNRDAYSFEWFASLLSELESQDDKMLLDLHIYMTGGRAGAAAMGLEIARELRREAGKGDLVTGLRAMTHMGQPDFRAILEGIARQHSSAVDVFFCGPLALGRKLRAICLELGLRFREERF